MENFAHEAFTQFCAKTNVFIGQSIRDSVSMSSKAALMMAISGWIENTIYLFFTRKSQQKPKKNRREKKTYFFFFFFLLCSGLGFGEETDRCR